MKADIDKIFSDMGKDVAKTESESGGPKPMPKGQVIGFSPILDANPQYNRFM
jgi:hypothetical protein